MGTLVYYICVAMSLSQSPREILMVRPCNFMFNQETAVTNHYQDENTKSSDNQWRQKAVEEFDTALATLRENSIKVTMFQDMPYHVRPDAVFPTIGSQSITPERSSSTPW